MRERTGRCAAVVLVSGALLLSACGSDSPVTAGAPPTTAGRDYQVPSFDPGTDRDASSTTSIPSPDAGAEDDLDGSVPYEVLDSPRDFDAVIGSLTPKTDAPIGGVCVAYFEMFAGYRLLDQFAGSEANAVTASELAAARVHTAEELLGRVSDDDVRVAALADSDLTKSEDALVALHERLQRASESAGRALERASATEDRAARDALAGAVLELPEDEAAALDELMESKNGCDERR